MTSTPSHWLELESDPGLFTLLLEDFGVQNVQVEEIYDLSHPIENDEVYGFIFLFKWEGGSQPSGSVTGNKATRTSKGASHDDRKSIKESVNASTSRKSNRNVLDSDIFFAHQIVTNSCATHALLSILMNCDDRIKLGELLARFKERSKNMSPERIGEAIGEMPELAQAHNRHARSLPNHENHPRSSSTNEKSTVTRRPSLTSTKHCQVKDDTFHFVCYIPIHGFLYELDGLKPFPINHGKVDCDVSWTEHCRHVIQERMQEAERQDLRYNLMAVVPDRRVILQERLVILRRNYDIIQTTLSKILDHIGHALLGSEGYPTVSISQVSVKADADLKQESSTDAGGAVEKKAKQRGRPPKKIIIKEIKSEPTVTNLIEETDGECLVPERARFNATIINSDNVVNLTSINTSDSTNGSVSSSDVTFLDKVKPEPLDIFLKQTGCRIIPTLEAPDVTRPLSIETQFLTTSGSGSGPSTRSSTGSSRSQAKITPTTKTLGPASYSTRLRFRKTQQLTEVCPECKGDLSQNGCESCHQETGNAAQVSTMKNRCFTPHELCSLLKLIEDHIKVNEANLQEEIEKRKKFEMDDARRTFNYDNFIEAYLLLLHESGQLKVLLDKGADILKQEELPTWKLRTRRSKHRRK